MQLKIYNNENTYVVNGPVYVNETTKIWCGKISDGEFKGAFVKILNYGELDDKAAKNELKNVLREEVNTLKQVSKCSKRVPSVKDYWDDTRESRYVVIMDTMPGVSLRAWLDKHQRDELQAKDIFIRKCLVIQICEIMRDISNKYPVLVHRDLKPENIFVNFNKETKKWDIYIIDFGGPHGYKYFPLCARGRKIQKHHQHAGGTCVWTDRTDRVHHQQGKGRNRHVRCKGCSDRRTRQNNIQS